MKTFLTLLWQIPAVIFAADFAGGFVHWLEDAYIREDTPLIGKWIARPNIVHHHYPRFMTRHNWWYTSRDLVLLVVLLLISAACLGLLTWQVWLFAALAANANEFHKWEHRTRKENGRFISFLQDLKLLQTAKHHALHHTDPKNSHYCTITNFPNLVLDGIRFWDGLEWLLAKTVGLTRRPDTSVRGHGPGPTWLEEYRRQPA
ncbi:MAG: fatty acid desaturase CarF family protein [Limisphaerales bacterium]